MKIYVPQDNTYNKCYVIQSEGVIRGYNKVPSSNTTYNYRDYYIRTDYYYRDGSGSWGNTFNITCIDNSLITHDFYYRYDFTSILLNFTIISLFGLYLPWLIFKSLFGRRLL